MLADPGVWLRLLGTSWTGLLVVVCWKHRTCVDPRLVEAAHRRVAASLLVESGSSASQIPVEQSLGTMTDLDCGPDGDGASSLVQASAGRIEVS